MARNLSRRLSCAEYKQALRQLVRARNWRLSKFTGAEIEAIESAAILGGAGWYCEPTYRRIRQIAQNHRAVVGL